MSKDKRMNKLAVYQSTTLAEELAGKVITRVVSDGQSLRNAVREAIKIAELNKQEIFLLLSVLQRYGMVSNGDYKNYWSVGLGEGVGKEGVDTNLGTNYYASDKNKILTADLQEKEHFELFKQVENLRKANFTDEEILQVNPELNEILATINRTGKVIAQLDELEGEDYDEDLELLENSIIGNGVPNSKFEMSQHEAELNLGKFVEAQSIDLSLLQNMVLKAKKIYDAQKNNGLSFEEAFHRIADNSFPNMNWQRFAPFIKKFIPDYEPLKDVNPSGLSSNANLVKTAQAVNQTPAPAQTEDITVNENDDNLENNSLDPVDNPLEQTEVTEGSEEINVGVTPTPNELSQMAKEGPQWEITNLLSISKAQEYYEQLKKQLEAVVFNANIKMDIDTVSKYDKVRNQIDSEINKIKEAQKGKEKLEKKEETLKSNIEEEQLPQENTVDKNNIKENQPELTVTE